MKSRIYFFAILFFVLHTSISVNSTPILTDLTIESQIIGTGIVGHTDAPYRITVTSWNNTIAIYPSPLQGILFLDVGSIDSLYTINALIEIQLLLTEKIDPNQYQSFVVSAILANFSIEANTNYEVALFELNSSIAGSYELDNGTTIPRLSYDYYEEVNTDFFVTSINLLMEQSNHKEEWDSELGFEGLLQLNLDPELHNEMQEREEKANEPFRTTGRINYSSISLVAGLMIIPVLLKRHKHVL